MMNARRFPMAACVLVSLAMITVVEAGKGNLRHLQPAIVAATNGTDKNNATSETEAPTAEEDIVMAFEANIPDEEMEPPPPPPSNDLCVNALGSLTVSPPQPEGSPPLSSVLGTNVGATLTDRSAAMQECRFAGRPAVWYKITGDGGMLTASTCAEGTTLDTRLTIFSGSCGNLECVGYNDDAFRWNTAAGATCAATMDASQISFATMPGIDYYIAVSGLHTRVGDFELTLEGFNDHIEFAYNVPVGGAGLAGDTSDSQVPMAAELEDCGYTSSDYYGEWYTGPEDRIPRGLWYQAIGTGGRLKAMACSQGTQMHVFAAADGGEGSCIGGGRGSDNLASGCTGGVFEWDSILGVKYYIAVHSLFRDPTYDGDASCGQGWHHGDHYHHPNCPGPVFPFPFVLTVEEVNGNTVSVGRNSDNYIFD